MNDTCGFCGCANYEGHGMESCIVALRGRIEALERSVPCQCRLCKKRLSEICEPCYSEAIYSAPTIVTDLAKPCVTGIPTVEELRNIIIEVSFKPITAAQKIHDLITSRVVVDKPVDPPTREQVATVLCNARTYRALVCDGTLDRTFADAILAAAVERNWWRHRNPIPREEANRMVKEAIVRDRERIKMILDRAAWLSDTTKAALFKRIDECSI